MSGQCRFKFRDVVLDFVGFTAVQPYSRRSTSTGTGTDTSTKFSSDTKFSTSNPGRSKFSSNTKFSASNTSTRKILYPGKSKFSKQGNYKPDTKFSTSNTSTGMDVSWIL